MRTVNEVLNAISTVDGYVSDMLAAIEAKGVTIPQDASYGTIPLLVAQIGGSPVTPDGQLNWLENAAGSYIDLNYSIPEPSSEYYDLEIKYKQTNSSKCLIGCGENASLTNPSYYRFNIYDAAQPVIYIGNKSTTVSTSYSGQEIVLTARRRNSGSIVTSSNGTTYYKVGSGSMVEGSSGYYYGGAYSFYLWGKHDTNGASALCDAGTRVYYIKIMKNGTTIKNYVPYMHDGMPCLYETVGGTYHYNIGSGTLNYG